MHLIGPIVKLQVQVVSLKVGKLRWRHYDPKGLRSVPALELNDGGVQGWTAGDEPLADVHHRDHPDSKNSDGVNGISVGFTSHYAAMRTHFSDHLTDGIAGENILVATDTLLTGADLADRLIIATADGRELRLGYARPAAPCVEFSRYALKFPEDARPNETVTEALRFLGEGMRGFYAAYHGPAERISVGDRLFLAGRGQ
jgi:hypothetical protein